MLYKRELLKPDGRALILYADHPIAETISAVSPSLEPISVVGAHLRWHPLRGEWVGYAGHRQNRTFLPPKEYNPLAVTRDPLFPTELPEGEYTVAVFENRFPTLSLKSRSLPMITGIEVLPATGSCEVVVFTKDAESSLSRLSLSHLELILEVWGDRTLEIGKHPEIKYVMPFENRGVEVGVTLHHPHGQIYAYPFIPPLPKKELEQQELYYDKTGRSLLADFFKRESEEQMRTLYSGDFAYAGVPACARYPYEVWLGPRRKVRWIYECTPQEIKDLARALKTVLLKYDGLWNRPFPYLMSLHQAPTDGADYPYAHLHFEFSPPYRSSDRLKYLAGTELSAGMFANDSFPEEKAKELQNVQVDLGA